MKIVQFKNGNFGVRRWNFYRGFFGEYEFLTQGGVWETRSGYNADRLECQSKETAERRLKEHIDEEAAYQVYKNAARDMGKAVK